MGQASAESKDIQFPMPIYHYRCEACGHDLEALQKLSDEPLKHCPSCGEAALRKQVTAASFRLKGTGWYETDFKNKSPGREDAAKSDSGKKDKPADAGKAAGDKASTGSGSGGTKAGGD